MGVDVPCVLLRGDATGGRLAVIELTGQGRPPLHRHDFDETFYVLAGALTFQLDDERVTRRAGELAFAPRGVPHTYANLSGTPARALLVLTPAGFEPWFDGIAARATGSEPARAPAPAPALPEVVTVGPPLADGPSASEASSAAPLEETP